MTEEDEIRPLSDQEKIESTEFVHCYPHPKPFVENQPEYFSSAEERMSVAAPHLPDLTQKKSAHRRMRIIILVDIVLFLVILGVIYPSLYKLQTRGKLGGYRFAIEKSRDDQLLNILIKTERLISAESQATEYEVRILSDGQQIYRGQSELPNLDSPVKYALFPLSKPSLETQNFDITIRLDREEKNFFLSIDPDKD